MDKFFCWSRDLLVRALLVIFYVVLMGNSFGYDQGMMGGVNTAPDYVRVMGLGTSAYEGPSQGYVVTITEPTKQGGIVSSQ